MGVTICELDLTRLVLKKYKPDIITDIGPCKIKMILESKDIIEVVDEDPLLQQEMVDAGQDVLEKASKAIAAELKGFDDDASKVLEKTGLREGTLKFAQAFEKYYGDSAEEAGDTADAAIEKVWKDYVKTHKEYNKYRLKIVGKVTLGAIGVGAGVAGAIANSAIADVPGAILSGIGAAKALSTTLQTLNAARKSAAVVYSQLLSDIEDLKAQYDDMSKTSATAKEVFAKAVDKFTTVSLNSAKKCEGNLAAFKSKLGGIEKDSHTVSRELNKLLLQAEKIEKGIKDSGIEKLINKVKGHFTKVNTIDDAIEMVAVLLSQVKAGKIGAGDAAAAIDTIKEKIDKRVYTGAAIVIDLAGLALDGWGGGTESKDFEKAPEIVGNVVTGLQGLQSAFDDYFKNEK